MLLPQSERVSVIFAMGVKTRVSSQQKNWAIVSGFAKHKRSQVINAFSGSNMYYFT